MSTLSNVRPGTGMALPGGLALVSGIAGLVSFACLLTYLFTPGFLMSQSGAIPNAARLLLNTDFVAAALQALLMLPIVHRFAAMTRECSPGLSRVAYLSGLAGFSLVAVLRVLTLFKPAVSDILFMAPTALAGVWLFLVNRLLGGLYPRVLRVLGMIAGVFLVGVGLNFVFNGGLAVFTRGPFAYGNDVPFHIGLALTGAPAFTLFPLWSILVGMRLRKSF